VAARPHDPNEPSAIRTSKLKTNAQGYWEVHYSEKGRSKRQSCLTRDANEAKRWLKDWHDEIRMRAARTQQTRVPTIEELCQGYLEYIESRGRTNANRLALRPIRRELGFHTPDELADDWQEEYHAKRGVSSGSLRRELNTLHAVLNWAAKKKLISRDNMPEFEMPPSGAARTAHLDRDQEQWFWDQAIAWGHRDDLPQRSREAAYRVMLFVTIGLSTAARRGAIMQLTWDRVDLVNDMIDFRVPKQLVTRKRKVQVPIADRLRPVLQEAAKRAPKDADGQPTGRVLSDLSRITRVFVTFTEAIGMTWVTPHVLRHTWATLASRNNVPEPEIAAIMGDTIKTIHDNYVHYRPDYLRASINHHATQPGASP
jgi:integrase